MKKICVSELQAITSGLDELFSSCQKARQALSKLENVYGKRAEDVFSFPQCHKSFPVKTSDPQLLLSYLTRNDKFVLSLKTERLYREHGDSTDFVEKFTIVATIKQ